jgi:tetratricopeptide (TPR) repeat protein
MVGRDRELEFLVSQLGEALKGNGSVIFLVGEAGIGKTRVCEEFERLGRSAGCEVLIGNCIPGAPVPYLPFEEAFQRHFTVRRSSTNGKDFVVNVETTESSLIEFADGSKPSCISPGAIHIDDKRLVGDPRSESERTLFSTLELLRSLSRDSPVIMRLEDLHWADSASTQLLHFLARNLSGMRVLIVGTYRPEDISSEDPEKKCPLVESLRIMRREGICQELNLDRLQPNELDVVVKGMLEGTVDDDLLHRIASESEGNPLCAIEIVRLLVVSNAIAMHKGVWKADELKEIEIPSTVKEVILRRIERVPKKYRRILESAAAIGGCFDVQLLQEAFSYNRLALLESLELMEKEHQLIRSSEGYCQFTHEKIRQVLHEGISDIRKREIHRLIGEALESRLPNDALLLELSNHFCTAGENEKCIRYSLLAGESCLKRYALAEAAPYLERVVNRARNDPDKLQEYLRALEGLGTAHVEFCNYKTSVSYFEKFIANSRNERDRARVLRKEAECWVSTRLGKGDNSRFEELVRAAESIPEIDANDIGEIMSMRSMISMWEGRLDDADQFMTKAEEIFKSTGNEDRLALQYAYHLVIPISKGLTSEAVEKAREVLTVFERLKNPSGELEVRNYLGIAYMHCGQLELAKKYLRESIEIAGRIGDHVGLCWGHIYLSIILDEEGFSESSLIEAEKAKKFARVTESEYMLSAARAVLAHELLRLNRFMEAESLCRENEEFERTFDWKTGTPVRGLIMMAQAELRQKEEMYDESNEMFEKAIDCFHRCYYCSLIHEMLARIHYADSLIEQGNRDYSLEQLHQAGEIVAKMGNQFEKNRIENRINLVPVPKESDTSLSS